MRKLDYEGMTDYCLKHKRLPWKAWWYATFFCRSLFMIVAFWIITWIAAAYFE